MKKTLRILFTAAIVLALPLAWQIASAAPAQVKATKTIGNADAPKGGIFYQALGSEPETLNPFSSTDAYSSEIQQYVLEGLMILDYETYEYMPGLAESYEEGKDGMSYTFHLRKDAVWSDGKPVTAEDVKFSFDAIRNPDYKASHMLPYFENVEKATVVDKHTIRFDIKKKYFNNFNVLASGGYFAIVPKHVYNNPKKRMNKKLVGSGPYVLDDYDRGKSIELKRNPKWWGWKADHLAGRYNFDKMYYRFVKDENLRLEMLKKGRIDLEGLSPEAYTRKTKGAPFGKTILKKKVENSAPKGYSFVGWNLKKDIFQDRDVRVALAHLMNRDLMNEKFRYDMSVLTPGPWYPASPYANDKVKPITFDRDKANKMLKKAGWTDADKNGVLEKEIDGKKKEFRFTLMFVNPDSEKYMTMYKEDLKKSGIHMDLKRIEWNSFIKSLDEKRFDAVMLGWSGGSIHNDPKQIWHSEAARAGGSNFISYKNEKVDKLIDKGRQVMNDEERQKIWKEIYKLIAEDAPYAFMFNEKYTLYAHSKKMGMVKPTYKYGVGESYWWMTK